MLAVHTHQQNLVEYNYKRQLQRRNWAKGTNDALPDNKTIALSAALRTAGRIVKKRTHGSNSGNFLLEFCIKSLEDFRYAKEVFERLHPIEKSKDGGQATQTNLFIVTENEIIEAEKAENVDQECEISFDK